MKSWLLLLITFVCSPLIAQDWESLSRKSVQSYSNGSFVEALAYADSALQLSYFENGDKNVLFFAASLVNMAFAQRALGLLDESLSNFRQASELYNQYYGLPHADQIETHYQLGRTYLELAKYDSAYSSLTEGRKIFLSIPQKNKAHYDTASYQLFESYAKIRSFEASLVYAQGDDEDAVNILKSLLKEFEYLYGDSVDSLSSYQTSINNLVTYSLEGGLLEEAEFYAKKYLHLVKKASPIDQVYALINLGAVKRKYHEFDSAVMLWNRGLNILEVGENHYPKLKIALYNNLGELFLSLGSYKKAVQYLRNSLQLQKEYSSLSTRNYKSTLYNLASTYHLMGEYPKADSSYTLLIDQVLLDFKKNFKHLNEEEKLIFYRDHQQIIEEYKNFGFDVAGLLPLQESDQPYINHEVIGRLYDLQLQTKGAVLNSSRKMRKAILMGEDPILKQHFLEWMNKKKIYSELLMTGENEPEALNLQEIIEEEEKWLISHSDNFKKGFTSEKKSWRQIQQSLEPGEASVEFMRLFDGLLYLAFILTPETRDMPLVSIIRSDRQGKLEEEYYRNYINSIRFDALDTVSYSVYFQPVIDSLAGDILSGNIKKIYVSNDGILHKINLETLFNPHQEQYLTESIEIRYVNSTHDITDDPQNSHLTNSDALLLSKARFSEFPDLPDLNGVTEEVTTILSAFTTNGLNVLRYNDDKAQEIILKKVVSPGYIHLATHGNFINVDYNFDAVDAMISSSLLLSSGVGEDGVVTAYEVMDLNLDSTFLVTLSACNTALGKISYGEGVYGLQRAFLIAGADHIMMSLWPVDDSATRDYMLSFYTALFETSDIYKALKISQIEMMKKYDSPKYWGAFVLLSN